MRHSLVRYTWHLLETQDLKIVKLLLIEDRRQTAALPRPHVLRGLRLPLASSAPRRTRHRAKSQLMTSQWKPVTTVISEYAHNASVAHLALTFDLDL